MQGGSPSEPERSSSHGDHSNWLPDGWTVEVKTRKGGNSKGKTYKCYVSPEGRKCYSKKQVFDYLKKIGTKEAHDHENTAIFQTKRQRTTTVEGSSSDTVVKDSVEIIPWSLFVFVAEAVRHRKLCKENKKDKRLKKRLKVAEETLHSITPMFKDEVRADWSYDPETAGTLVSREDEDDSGSELVSVSTFLENEKNRKKKIKRRKCCGKKTPREARWARDIVNSRQSELERNLYVGNLPSNMTELRFKQIFEAYGPVECVYELPTDPKTGRCKGLGYIQFAKLEHAKAAQSLNGLEIDGQTLKVCSFLEQKHSRF